MGFNNWNAFGCDVSEKLIKETADFFVSSGLKDAGYRYVNIDDCWSLRERGKDGKLVPDPAKFPAGIRGLADYVHGRGLKLGIYGDAGTMTCAGYPGSLGQEKLDAQTWADWGVDYVKYDNCYNQSDGSRADFVRRYTAMREAIDATGRPMVYSICEWGQSQPWEWATGVGNLWRTTGDISDNWSSLRSIIAQNAPLARYAGPGHWNDPDMLEIGNGGMTPTEYRTHMSSLGDDGGAAHHRNGSAKSEQRDARHPRKPGDHRDRSRSARQTGGRRLGRGGAHGLCQAARGRRRRGGVL